MTVADRWFYMPMIGLLGMFGLILQSVIPKLLKYKTAGIIFAVTIIFALSIRTILRNSNWQNAIDLYSHDMQISNNYNLEYNLGIEYVKMKKYTQAIHHFKKSVALRPYELNLRNLGAAYADNGNIQKAKIYTAMALQAKDYNLFFPHKHDSATYTNYAAFLVFFDDPFISERFIQDSLRDYPDNLNLLVYLALAKYLQHDKKSALRFASQAYNLHQNNTTSYLYNSLQNNQPFQFSFKGKTIQFDE